MKKIYLILCLALPVIIFSACSKKSDSSSVNNDAVIAKLKAVSDSIILDTSLHVPGIVALVVDKNMGINWIYKGGYSDLESKKPMDDSFTFRIGSNTKTMTGTVLLQLVDEGYLKLEDKLSRFFPDFPKSDSITIRMLCNMSSGIYNYSEGSDFQDTLDNNPSKVWPPLELLDLAFRQPFYFPVGKGFHYSNSNTIILGLIIEQITHTSLETQMENRIFGRLGLGHTRLITAGKDLPGSHPHGYYTGFYQPGCDCTETIDISWGWAAGSAYSTPRELQKYVEAIVEGGLISDSLQKRRLTEMIEMPPKGGYGLCMVHRGSFFGHNGSIPGFSSSMYHSKIRNATVIIYFNCQLTNIEPDYLFLRYANILYGPGF